MSVMPEPNYSLSELNRSVRLCLEHHLPGRYWVRAETSEVRTNASGHCYLELVEKGTRDQMVARMRAMIWSNTWSSLRAEFKSVTGMNFESGMNVMVLVRIAYHELYGMSLVIEDIDPAYSMGEMARLRRECIERLRREGLMELNSRVELPCPIRRIAIISSPTAAGYQDFMRHLPLFEGNKIFHTALFPANMQGQETTRSVVAALERIRRNACHFDVVVLIRGGGAVAELQAFDDYALAAALAQCELPVFTGIGHDRDTSVADMVAHHAFKTPTAVADYLVAEWRSRLEELQEQQMQLREAVRHTLLYNGEWLGRLQYKLPLVAGRQMEHARQSIIRGEHRLKLLAGDVLRNCTNRLDMLRIHISQRADYLMQRQHERDTRLTEDLRRAVSLRMAQYALQLSGQEQAIRLSDPKHILRRGFSVVRQQGHALRSIRQVDVSSELSITLSEGILRAKPIE